MPPKKSGGAAKTKVASGRKQAPITNVSTAADTSSEYSDDDGDYTVIQRPDSFFPTLPRSQGLGDLLREAMMPVNTEEDQQPGTSSNRGQRVVAASSGTQTQTSGLGRQKSSGQYKPIRPAVVFWWSSFDLWYI